MTTWRSLAYARVGEPLAIDPTSDRAGTEILLVVALDRHVTAVRA